MTKKDAGEKRTAEDPLEKEGKCQKTSSEHDGPGKAMEWLVDNDFRDVAPKFKNTSFRGLVGFTQEQLKEIVVDDVARAIELYNVLHPAPASTPVSGSWFTLPARSRPPCLQHV